MKKLAVIKTGGKQYKISEGQKIKIEKLDTKEGNEVKFSEVLLVADEKIEVGTPILSGKEVAGKILKQGRAKKVTILKFKRKTRYKVKKGHRQPFSEVEIVAIK